MTGLDDITQELAASRPGTTPLVGEEWFGGQADGCTMLMAVPLSRGMMVAALFAAGQFVTAEDLADDTEAWGFIGQVVVREGTDFLEELSGRLLGGKQPGQIPDVPGQDKAGWLAFCQHRVDVLTACDSARA